jgi:type IV pilus assembly protein PilA
MTMYPRLIPAMLVGFSLMLSGCGQREEKPKSSAGAASAEKVSATTALVKDTERSRHFNAVNERLELGGTMYGYVDVDGDATKLAGSLQTLLQNVGRANPMAAPFVNQDYAALFAKLGLNDVKAIGVSSVPEGNGFFRNRTFFYTPEGRHGLLAGLGGKPGPFTHLALAPANTDIYSESEIDLPAIYVTVQDVLKQLGGDTAKNALDEALEKAGRTAMISWLKLINATKGHLVLVARFDADKTFRVPGPGAPAIPAFSFLLRIDGVGSAVEDALKGSPELTASNAEGMRLYEFNQPLPLEGLKPIVGIEGSTLFFATTREFLTECRAKKSTLGDDPEFKKGLARVGTEGNGLTYVTPRVFRRLREIETLNPNLPAEVKSMLGSVMNQLPQIDQPLVTLRVNQPDGILVRSSWNRSLKQDVAMVSVYNPVTVGLLAAMAVPAFQKVRAASQGRTAQEQTVLNNLRQFHAAGEQFCLERGVNTAGYNDLVGPAKLIRALPSVMGEDYRTLRFVVGQPLRVALPNGRVVEYKQ